ncbi:hypothetical protein M438DRAFT_193366 [Aureobasidium pullulans EXF-150]|uniref:Uncharacterized protein n=1 Tax=Aureobasidium pullulans EXF-150 TaxID=1043002 RepID=A0A074XIG9_AURPU|nr:uncharacterized protein M438DRAFT_193366 [Aureobasidium pullulans EXF-150]KEQ85305.1 hypothetical protein M438DRAFT_193366 [Aureobasidium pullulans EXF-150]
MKTANVVDKLHARQKERPQGWLSHAKLGSVLKKSRLPRSKARHLTSRRSDSLLPLDLRPSTFIPKKPFFHFSPSFIMSKRSVPDDKPASLPFAKKSRLEIDEGLAEVRAKGASLLEGLKLQKTTFQWPQPSAREEIITNIAKAESMMSSLTKLEQKSKNASETVEKLIDAIINNELNKCSVLHVETWNAMSRDQKVELWKASWSTMRRSELKSPRLSRRRCRAWPPVPSSPKPRQKPKVLSKMLQARNCSVSSRRQWDLVFNGWSVRWEKEPWLRNDARTKM